MYAAQHTAAALRRLRTSGRSESPTPGHMGRASAKIESAGGGGAKQRSEGSLPVTPREYAESYMRTLHQSRRASDRALHSHGRSLCLEMKFDQDVTVPGASTTGPNHRKSDRCRDPGKPQADRRSSPAETHARTPCTPAFRDQVLPALLEAGLILLMTVAALGLLAGYVLMFNSFHNR